MRGFGPGDLGAQLPLSDPRKPRWALLYLAVLTFLPMPPLRAQTPAFATTDLFAELHAGLERAANFELEQAAEDARRAAEQPRSRAPQATTADMPARNGLPANASVEKLSAVRERLQALGVDAGRIFAEEGVPLELLVLAEVESSFDPLALSPKGARGVWQLMPETAMRFGLRVDKQMDERVHPVRSTRAAAQYLRELHEWFGDWLLALAAYNAGEARVLAAIKLARTRDFWQLSAQGLLPKETRRYVPAVLARAALQ
jgi:soluble lytic murein transglycosylase-like protein